MKSFLLLSSLLFISTVAFADTKCTGIADGYEEITLGKDSITVHGWDNETKYKINSNDDGVLFSNGGLLAIVSDDKKSVSMYLGQTQVHKPTECKTSPTSTDCSNKKGSVKITKDSVSIVTKKTTTTMKISSQDATFISGEDFDTASHGSYDGFAVSISKKQIRSISGRFFSYSCK